MNKLIGYRINPREMQNEIVKALLEILERMRYEKYDDYPFVMIEVTALKSYSEEIKNRIKKKYRDEREIEEND